MLMEHQQYLLEYPALKKLLSMVGLSKSSIAILASSIAHHDAPTALYVTIVSNDSIIIALGLVNALDWYVLPYFTYICSYANKHYVYTQCAAQLPVLLSVRIFLGCSLLFRVFHVSFVYKISHRWTRYGLESSENVTCINNTNGLLLHLFMVRWWSHLLSFVSHQHKPGLFPCKFFSWLIGWLITNVIFSSFRPHMRTFVIEMRLLFACMIEVYWKTFLKYSAPR